MPERPPPRPGDTSPPAPRMSGVRGGPINRPSPTPDRRPAARRWRGSRIRARTREPHKSPAPPPIAAPRPADGTASAVLDAHRPRPDHPREPPAATARRSITASATDERSAGRPPINRPSPTPDRRPAARRWRGSRSARRGAPGQRSPTPDHPRPRPARLPDERRMSPDPRSLTQPQPPLPLAPPNFRCVHRVSTMPCPARTHRRTPPEGNRTVPRPCAAPGPALSRAP